MKQTVAIKLTQGKSALVDLADYKALSNKKWQATRPQNIWYAVSQTKTALGHKTTVRMHRLLLGITDPAIHIDHINGNGLDNRRANIRIVSPQQNTMNRPANKNNRSGFKGVSWDKSRRRWFAHIRINYKKFNLGRYKSRLDAARAYNRAARFYFPNHSQFNDVSDAFGDSACNRGISFKI